MEWLWQATRSHVCVLDSGLKTCGLGYKASERGRQPTQDFTTRLVFFTGNAARNLLDFTLTHF
jgi:hypothetical protein